MLRSPPVGPLSLQVGLFCLAGSQGISVALGALLAGWCPALGKRPVKLPLLREHVPLAYVLSGAAGMACCALWLPFRSRDWAWALQDAIGVCIVVLFIRSIRVPSLKVRALRFLTFTYMCPLYPAPCEALETMTACWAFRTTAQGALLFLYVPLLCFKSFCLFAFFAF